MVATLLASPLPSAGCLRATRSARPSGTACFGAFQRAARPSKHTVATASAPVTWSISDYDDVTEEKYKCEVLGRCAVGQPATTPVRGIMDTNVATTHPKASIHDLDFTNPVGKSISGLPVVNERGELVGVISKKDMRQTWDDVTCVRDVMSSPAISITPENTIMEAACLMLKYKIHRLPVVDEGKHVVGMVTRTDIFAALAIFK